MFYWRHHGCWLSLTTSAQTSLCLAAPTRVRSQERTPPTLFTNRKMRVRPVLNVRISPFRHSNGPRSFHLKYSLEVLVQTVPGVPAPSLGTRTSQSAASNRELILHTLEVSFLVRLGNLGNGKDAVRTICERDGLKTPLRLGDPTSRTVPYQALHCLPSPFPIPQNKGVLRDPPSDDP
jgi:hypothetical protein